jgi:hypothetical protein
MRQVIECAGGSEWYEIIGSPGSFLVIQYSNKKIISNFLALNYDFEISEKITFELVNNTYNYSNNLVYSSMKTY